MTSIRVRLLALLSGTIAAMAVVHAAVTWRVARADAGEQFDLQLQQAAALVLRGRFVPGERGAAPADRIAPAADLMVRIDDGTAAWASHPGAGPSAGLPQGFATVDTPEGRLRVYSAQVGARTIRVAQFERVRDAQARRAALRNLVPLAVVVPGLMLLAWAVVARALRPLDSLAARLRERDPGALSPIGTQGLPRELVPMVGALDALLARLGDTLAMQRAFIADAAHELRTPVAALRLQVQVLRRSRTPAEQAARVDALEGSVERASRLVAQLLTLARSARPAGQVDGEVDIAAICREAAAAVLPVADLAGATIEAELPESSAGCDVAGDPAQLEALVRNLLENAIRHAGGGPVRLSLREEGANVVIVVSDRGPGIPVAERERVFDRFHRLRGAAPEGSGLGLAIVRSVARGHGGDAWLDDSDGPPQRPGLRAIVSLPRARAGACGRAPTRAPRP